MRYGSNDYTAIHAAESLEGVNAPLQEQEQKVLPLERGGIDPKRKTEKAGAGDSVSDEKSDEKEAQNENVISQMIAFKTKGENDA
jgi:hypothetical protein